MSLHTQVLTDFIMHRGNTGAGEGVALIWLHGPCTIPADATVMRPLPGGNSDLTIQYPGNQITLKSVAADLHAMILASGGLHIIHQSAGAKPESFFLPITDC